MTQLGYHFVDRRFCCFFTLLFAKLLDGVCSSLSDPLPLPSREMPEFNSMPKQIPLFIQEIEEIPFEDDMNDLDSNITRAVTDEVWSNFDRREKHFLEYINSEFELQSAPTKNSSASFKNLETLQDFEDSAYKKLSKNAVEYFASGALTENTLRENINAYRRYRIRPRVMVNVRKRAQCVRLLGYRISIPVAIAPIPAHQWASDGGEIDTAKAAYQADTIMVLSTFSTKTLEEVAEAVPKALKWQQVYFFENKSVTEDIVKRAERNGYKAIVLTVDSPVFGRSLQNNYFQLPNPLKYANIEKYLKQGDSDVLKYIRPSRNSSWDDVKWLRNITKLPIVVKGILTGDDAKKAAEVGVHAIYVSNSGGRQLENSPSTIEALPDVMQAVQGKNVEVYIDGGVRNGTDILVATALGARAVFIGRPNIWGLAVGGAEGAFRVLDRLSKEFDLVLALVGLDHIRKVYPELVVRHHYYSKISYPRDKQ